MRRFFLVSLSTAFLASFLISAVWAQSGFENPPLIITTDNGAGAKRIANCEDFQNLPDGSWTNRQAVWINGYFIAGPVHFPPGMKMNDLDIAAALNAKCLAH